jgi:1-acyl-sn-glycerol-3-phosphate acyltransferase
MKSFLKFIQILYTVYAALSFVLLLLIIFPFVFIASFFGKIKGGNFIYRICSYWSDAWFFMIGIYCRKIMETPYDAARQYIFVANHISYMDVPMIVKVIRQPVRALGKSEMSRIPIFGFLYRNAVVMVDRSDANNRAKSVITLKSVIKKGISIFIFPEGTFNMTDRSLKKFYDGAFKIAIETQTAVKPVIFPDTLSRLHYNSIFSFNPGKCRAVFLEEIAVEGLTINDVQVLKAAVFNKMEEALERYTVHRS